MSNDEINNDVDKELRALIEDNDNPKYVRILALSLLETRKDVGHLKCVISKVYRMQVGIIAALITCILTVILSGVLP